MNTEQNKDKVLPASFVGRTERFYVLRNEGLRNAAIPPKYAVYSTVDAYNTRSETPYYTHADDALTDFAREVKIYAESLTTTPPAYPADRDETDYGLTLGRNIWRNRFNKAREGRSYVV